MKQTHPRRFLMGALSALAIASALGGCAPLVVGGAVMSGMVATDRRTSGAQLDDEGIELRTANRLRETLGDRGHVNVTSYNRQVLLTGEVPTEQDRQLVEKTVSGVENVRSVVNELAVMGSTLLTQRSSDALITGQVKARMVDAQDIFANAFKVVTERGAVYLMGRVTQREADRATELTRSVNGVQRVVRVLEIITDAELQRTLPQQPAPSTAPKS
jgi:osmotically-inducible protein OsmY